MLVSLLLRKDARSGRTALLNLGNHADMVRLVLRTGHASEGADSREMNLHGSIIYTGSNNDRVVILQAIGGTVPTATRTQQVP